MESHSTIKKTHVNFKYNFELLSLAVLNNLDYFWFCKNKYWYSNEFTRHLQLMLDHIQWYEVNIKQLSENVGRYDLNEFVLGNGFRSFDLIFQRYFMECYKFCKDLSSARESVLFLPSVYLKRLDSHVQVLDGLKPALNYMTKMIEESTSNQPLAINKHITAEELVKEYGLLDQASFYGRCQGFYFCGSMRKTLWGVSVLMAAFSDLYQKAGSPLSRAISAVLNGIKYAFDPELRSKHIVNVAQNASVEFVKSFWSLSETHFMKQLPKWICPKLEVLEEFWVPAESIQIPTVDGSKIVVIPVPCSHIPTAPVRCLLMSSFCRQGQLVRGKLNTSNSFPPSPALLFHCHGGGFISQTPESHEIYLRHWAHELNIPIVSVDYTLAPEGPFPRALEEILLVYAWALKNHDKLGWTGEKICFAGDSAGGNILLGIIIKPISLKIRKPDAILCAYTPLILNLVPSPSRLLCWLDPLLPFGFMLSCLDAYVGAMQTDDNEYVEAKKCNSYRERKLSSISDILDSSIMFLKECEWSEVRPNEPDTQDPLSSSGEDKKQQSQGMERSHKKLDQSSRRVKRSIEANSYVNSFINTYTVTSPYVNLNEQKEHNMMLDFYQDVLYDFKQKCLGLQVAALNQISRFFEDSTLHKMFQSLSPFDSRIGPLPIRESESSIINKIRRLKVVTSNPYISPLLVSEDVLKEMPKIFFVSLNFDPCLDDSITFAKRMEGVGNPVALDVLDGLPHGFLNFLPFSKEAHDGSDLCVRRIKEALNMLVN